MLSLLFMQKQRLKVESCLFRLGASGFAFRAGECGGGACRLESVLGGCESVSEGERFALDAFDEGEFFAAWGGVQSFVTGLLLSFRGLFAGGGEGIERFPPGLVGLQLG